MQTEHVILLNAQGVPTGTLEKYAAHTADTRLHLAFSICCLMPKDNY